MTERKKWESIRREVLTHVSSVARMLVIAVLTTSAVLKTVSPSDAVASASLLGLPHAVIVILVQCEFALAALAVASWSQLTKIVSIGFFAILAIASLYLAAGGHINCGCFGPIAASPWITLSIDFIVVALLALALKHELRTKAPHRATILGAALGYVTIGTASLVLIFASLPDALSETTGIKNIGQLVLLEPEEWIGRPFPLWQFIEPAVDLEVGIAILLLYHHDCPDCQAALPKYDRLAVDLHRSDRTTRIVAVEVPPYGQAPEFQGIESARLSDDRDWFVQAPVEITVENGMVVRVSRELPSIANSVTDVPKAVPDTTTVD